MDVLDSNTGNQIWTTTDSGNYDTSAPTIGTKKELLDRTASKGYSVYRITTQYYIYGPDANSFNASTNKLKSEVSYVKVKFTNK